MAHVFYEPLPTRYRIVFFCLFVFVRQMFSRWQFLGYFGSYGMLNCTAGKKQTKTKLIPEPLGRDA